MYRTVFLLSSLPSEFTSSVMAGSEREAAAEKLSLLMNQVDTVPLRLSL